MIKNYIYIYRYEKNELYMKEVDFFEVYIYIYIYI